MKPAEFAKNSCQYVINWSTDVGLLMADTNADMEKAMWPIWGRHNTNVIIVNWYKKKIMHNIYKYTLKGILHFH